MSQPVRDPRFEPTSNTVPSGAPGIPEAQHAKKATPLRMLVVFKIFLAWLTFVSIAAGGYYVWNERARKNFLETAKTVDARLDERKTETRTEHYTTGKGANRRNQSRLVTDQWEHYTYELEGQTRQVRLRPSTQSMQLVVGTRVTLLSEPRNPNYAHRPEEVTPEGWHQKTFWFWLWAGIGAPLFFSFTLVPFLMIGNLIFRRMSPELLASIQEQTKELNQDNNWRKSG